MIHDRIYRTTVGPHNRLKNSKNNQKICDKHGPVGTILRNRGFDFLLSRSMVTRLREEIRLPGEGWSQWEKAMVPQDDQSSNLEKRGENHVGSFCSSIRSAFPGEAQCCGIYEWRAKGTKYGQPNHVVYVGCTCRGNERFLGEEILEYCKNGLHKGSLINNALARGYELWVRVKTAECDEPRKYAEEMQNELLAHYNYAWNSRNNAIRDLLRP